MYQHDVRAKQARACDAERAGFLTPIFILVTSPACWRVITHASNYLGTDEQLKLTAVSRPSMNNLGIMCALVLSAKHEVSCMLWY